MCKVKGIAEKDPFWGYVVWINGNIVGALYPLLNKYFRIEKEIFFPTFFYYETQKLNSLGKETIYTAKHSLNTGNITSRKITCSR